MYTFQLLQTVYYWCCVYYYNTL